MERSETYSRIREAIESIPVIDCHEHVVGPEARPAYVEPISTLIAGYVHSDLTSAYAADEEMTLLADDQIPLEDKWPVFEKIWRRTEHTGYARVTKLILRDLYGEDEMSLEALKRVARRLSERTKEDYDKLLDDAGIRIRITNVLGSPQELRPFLDGTKKLSPRDRLVFPLPMLHMQARSHDEIGMICGLVGRRVTSLDEYLDVCRELIRRGKEAGIVGLKDQSAYQRGLDYANPTRADAESLFNLIMDDPRNSLGWPQAKPLDDFLFHSFMRMARDMDLPVQLHTGHMAGIRNDVAKTNPALLRGVLELHRDVRFDLFHGSWPYAGDLLFLVKNYPNVALDCCWLHIIDPVYATNLLHQAVGAVPHAKIHGFGGDYMDMPEYAVGHLKIARDNIAEALARCVDEGWLGRDEALAVAADWLFNNPNEFFRLGFERVSV